MLTESPPQTSLVVSRSLPARWWRWARTVVALAVIGGGCVYSWKAYPWKQLIPIVKSRFPRTTADTRPNGHLRVLFLGNSLTEYNGGLALSLQRLAESAGKKPRPIFDQVTKFGATWAQLWDVSQAREMIEQGHWDYVVLQDYSTAAMTYRSEMDVYGKRFGDDIWWEGARPVYFMTWPHDDQLPLQLRIANAYINVARANHGLVAPVGYAWQQVLKEQPRVTLFDSRDKPRKHPTPAGTYLSACVFYSMFFNQSPRGLTGRIFEGTKVYIDLSPSVAEYLQNTAWSTVKMMGSAASTRPAAE